MAVMTELEAEVPAGKEATLEGAYSEAIKSPEPGMVQTFLVRKGTIYRIITVWESREALDAMRGKGVPKGMLIFRAAGVEPTLTVFEIKNRKG